MHQRTGYALTISELKDVVDNRLPSQLFSPSNLPRETPFTWQKQFISGESLEPIATLASNLFNRWIAASALLILVALDAAVIKQWINQPTHTPSSPTGLATSIALVLVGVLVHELGHVSALQKFGRRSGGIGFGIYWIFPTFYADVSSTWRLRKRQRAIVDVGGLYLQSIYAIAVCIWALLSEQPETAYVVLWTTHFMMLYTLNPTLKFDGYWLLSDITGVSNLHSKILSSARACVERVRGETARLHLQRHQIWTLIVFSLTSLLYFSYLFISLTMSLKHAIHQLTNDHNSWWATAGTIALTLFLSFIFLMLARKCLGAISAVLAQADPDDMTNREETS